jgi:hypothetical protein
LRLEGGDLALGEREGRLLVADRRLVLQQVGGRLLLHLHGPVFALGQVLVASRLLLRERHRRLRLLHLRLAGGDLGLLHRDLRIDGLCVRLGLLHGRLGKPDGDLVVGRLDDQQHIALAHELIVPHRQLDDASRNLRRHGDDVAAHRAVARPRRLHVGVPHRPAEHDGDGRRGQRYQDRNDPHVYLGEPGPGRRRGRRRRAVGQVDDLGMLRRGF